MFRKGPIANLSANANATAFYLRSKEQNKYFITNTEWDVARDSIAMNAIVNERENANTIRRQEELREETKINGKRNKIRIDDIRKRQAEIRMKFIESNDFIRQCNGKEAIASENIAYELEMKNKLKQEIDDLEMKIENLNEFHEKFKLSIDELKPYENVLDEVVERMELFDSKHDFLDRFDALLLAQTAVSENDQYNLKSIEEMQSEMVKINNEATLLIAGLENELNLLQKKYEKSKADCLKWEDVLVPAKIMIGDRERSSFIRLDQIQQLYSLLVRRIGIEPQFKRNQVEQQLDFIKKEIETIEEIIKLSNEMVAIETRSDIAEHGSGRSGRPRK